MPTPVTARARLRLTPAWARGRPEAALEQVAGKLRSQGLAPSNLARPRPDTVVVRVEGLGFFRVQERARHQLEGLCRSLEGEGVVRGWEVYLELDPPTGRATPRRGRPDGPRAAVPLRTERRTP